MSKILIKITSRERPNACQLAVQSFLNFAKNKEDLILAFALDTDDPTLQDYLDFIAGLGNKVNVYLNINYSENKIQAINRGVPLGIDWKVLVVASDDMPCILPSWDEYLIREFEKRNDVLLWTFDGIQNRLNTFSIMDKEYYNRFGYIYHPSYKSFYSDNEAHEVAEELGRHVKADFQIIKHDHPQINGRKDNLFNKNQRFWNEDKENYSKRKLNGFK